MYPNSDDRLFIGILLPLISLIPESCLFKIQTSGTYHPNHIPLEASSMSSSFFSSSFFFFSGASLLGPSEEEEDEDDDDDVDPPAAVHPDDDAGDPVTTAMAAMTPHIAATIGVAATGAPIV